MPGRHDVAEPHVPAVAVVGVVAGEQVQIRVDGDVVDVALAARDDLQAGAVGADADHAAAAVLEASCRPCPRP